MKLSKNRILLIFLICLFNLGGSLQYVNAQIDTLDPVWVRYWQGAGNIAGPCSPLGFDICPCNSWDVHVYNDTIYGVGVRTDDVWASVRPLVLNAYSLNGDTLMEQTWSATGSSLGTGAGATVVIGDGDYLYIGGLVPIDSMGAALIQKWDLNGNLIWSHGWGDKTDHGHHEVNGLAIVDTVLYVSHYSAAAGFD
jgi:hypothetical protein